ncbi:hypothetical protein Tco_0166776 [Tanacetum coccineum]
MMCSEEDPLTSAISMYLGVLCIFIITGTTWESLMKRQMMVSSWVTLQWPKLSDTEGDEISFNENRSFPDDEFLKPISENSFSSKEPPEFNLADDHPAVNKPDNAVPADILESAEP